MLKLKLFLIYTFLLLHGSFLPTPIPMTILVFPAKS